MDQQNINFSSSEVLEKIRALNSDKKAIDFSNSKFSEAIEITGLFFSKDVSLRNCIFEKPVIFRDLVVNGIADLSSCHFRDSVIFKNIRFNSLSFYNQTIFSGGLEIMNCFFKGKTDFSNSIIEQSVAVNSSRFCFDTLFCNVILKKGIDIINSEFEGLFDISCDNEIEFRSIGKFYCVGTLFNKEARFRNREFLGVTTFKNVDFAIAPLFANCQLPHDIAMSNIKLFDVNSKSSEQNYRILSSILEDANDHDKSDFFKTLGNEAKHNIMKQNERGILMNSLWKAKKLVTALLIYLRNLFTRIIFAIKQREYQYITRKIFKTNYRKFYNYRSLKNLVAVYLRKPRVIKDNKPHILK